MRDYAKVSPLFWTGKTGKALKAAGHEAVIVGMYLMTSPHANMIGLYHCPITYIAYDTGLTIEGASKGLQSAIEADFCRYDHDSEYVFVHEFAAYQIGDELDPKDKRVQGVINELAKVPKNQCWQGFRARYAVAFHLPAEAKTPSPKKAPSKPLRSQKQEQEQEQEQKQEQENTEAPVGFVLPDWINRKHWDTWHSTPKRRKATADQKQMAVDKLDEWRQAGQDYAGALENAAIGGNQGLFLPIGNRAQPNKLQALEDRNRAVARKWAEENRESA